MNAAIRLLKGIAKQPPWLDEWLDPAYAEERRTVEFKREAYPDNQIACEIWVHNYKGISLHSKAVGQNSGDAFGEALRKIREVME